MASGAIAILVVTIIYATLAVVFCISVAPKFEDPKFVTCAQ